MSGPPPPLGHPWVVDVGQNENVNREPPPASLNSVSSAQATGSHEQVHIQHNVPSIGMVNGLYPPMGFMPPMMGIGIPTPMPFGPFFGGGLHSAGPLAPPRQPWNTPGFYGNPLSQFIGMGFPPGMALPPPPPGIVLGAGIAPFAPGIPLWSGGAVSLGAGVIGTGIGMSMGMGFGTGVGMWPGMNRPAPAMITEATANEQPEQGDVTQIPGGIPPGATHIESGEHTVVHVLKGNVCPWLLPTGSYIEVEILHVSCSTGINRLIQVCNENKECEGLALSEVHEMVNGSWEKGHTFIYGDTVSMVLTLKDAGWDNKRNRPGGQSLHVYLHQV